VELAQQVLHAGHRVATRRDGGMRRDVAASRTLRRRSDPITRAITSWLSRRVCACAADLSMVYPFLIWLYSSQASCVDASSSSLEKPGVLMPCLFREFRLHFPLSMRGGVPLQVVKKKRGEMS
jgi:hypothetical protein